MARDGGFIAAGYDDDLDEARKLRDEGRGVIAGMQADYASAAGIQSLKIKHNNVLGYFIETTATHADKMLSPPLNERFIHRQTTANAVRFTTVELSEMETRILNAGNRALEIEMRLYSTLKRAILDCATQLGRDSPRACRDRCLLCPRRARRHRGVVPARGRGITRLRDRGRASSGGRAGLARAGRRAIHRQRLRACGWRRGRRHLAADRPEHGGQIDLPPAERADRDAGADGQFRAGEIRPYRARHRSSSAASARRTISRAAARPSWSRWSKPRRSSTRPTSARW